MTVNQSKINDPRFWKLWRDSGAVETIEDAYKRNPEFETYLGKVNLIRRGYMGYETEARQLAEQNGIPLKALEEALPIGREKEYIRKVDSVRRGYMGYETEARQLAAQHGLSLKALEEALPIGRRKETARKKVVY